jgi:hypothetical protein
MTAYGATLSRGEHSAGTRGWYESHSFSEGSHREVAHITTLELTTVRLALKRFSQPLRAEGERDHSIAYRESGGDVDSESMGIEVSGIDGRVTTASSPLSTPWFDFRYSPPPLSAESLRRPPPRRRGVVAYLPTLEGVADHWWVGDSEHDLKLDWDQVELLRPPLEMIPQVPRKVQADQFEGLLFLPYWERQNWHQGLVAMSYTSQSLEPSPGPGKRWRATLLAFSPGAKTMTARHGWFPTASPVSQTDSQ